MKVDRLLREVQLAEMELAHQLVVLADRHAAERDLHHQGHSQARQCGERAERLTPFAQKYGAEPIDTSDADDAGPLERLRRLAADALRRSSAPAGQLLDDLRDTYLFAVQAEIEWALLMHVAEALRDRPLLTTAEECHERAEVAMKWLRTALKTDVAQIVVTG